MTSTQTITLTHRQTQALASFSAGRIVAEDGSVDGSLKRKSFGEMTQAEAKPLVKKGLLHPGFTTGQFGIKSWTLTEAGVEAFGRVRITGGRTFMVEA